MLQFDRRKIMERFNDMVSQGQPIIGGGAGTGLSAKCEEAGGIDLIILYNSGRYRMAGRGSLSGLLAYGNANEIVVQMAHEVLPLVRHTPVIAGVNGTDPFMMTEHFLSGLKAMGISGIQNFPTVGLIDGVFRQNLEETGMSYALEVEMIRSCPCAGYADHALRFLRGRCHGDGRRGGRYHHCAYGTDHGRGDRRGNVVGPRGLPGTDRCLGGGSQAGAAGCAGAVPWRPDRHT